MYTLVTTSTKKSSVTAKARSATFSSTGFLQKKSQSQADTLAKIIQHPSAGLQKENNNRIIPFSSSFQAKSTNAAPKASGTLERNIVSTQNSGTPLPGEIQSGMVTQDTSIQTKPTQQATPQIQPSRETVNTPNKDSGNISWLMEAGNKFFSTVPGFTLVTLILEKNPFTQKEVKPDAEAYVGGVMELVPGGKDKFEDLKKSGALNKAFQWVKTRITELGITYTNIMQLVEKTIADSYLPPLNKLINIFIDLINRITTFAKEVMSKILELIFTGLLGPTADKVLKVLTKSKETFNIIVQNPICFAGFLMDALKQGFDKFNNKILEHLKNGLTDWILGSLKNAGVVLPEKWDLQGVISLALQICGITYAKMRLKLVNIFGEENVNKMEKGFELMNLLFTKGPSALWEKLVDSVGNLKDMVFDAIQKWALDNIITTALKKIILMLNPVGAVVEAVLAIYKTLMIFLEKIDQIAELVASVVDSIALIAAGKLGEAANFVEQSMARTVPLIIGFLAGYLGLEGISKTIKDTIQKFQEKVDLAIDKALGWIVEKAKGFLAKGKAIMEKIFNWWSTKKPFTAGDGKEHTLFFEGEENSAKLMIASEKMTYQMFLTGIDPGNNSKMKDAKKDALVIAGKVDGIIKDDKIPKGDKTKEDAAQEAKAKKITKELEDLRKATAPLFGEIKAASEPNYKAGNPFALGTSISGLTVIHPPKNGEGTEPTKAAHPVYDILDNRRTGEKGASYYIRGHLLNHNLHGHGEWHNMTPLSREGNSSHEKDVESKVKTAVNSGMTLKYEVIPEYGKQPNKVDLIKKIKENDGELTEEAKIKISIVENEDHVPLSLKCSASSVEESKTKWSLGKVEVKNPVKRTYEDYQLGKTPTPLIVNINTCPEYHYKHLTGIDDKLSNKIIEYRTGIQKGNDQIQVFSKIEDLMKVTGIGTATIDKIKKKGNYSI